MKLYKQILIFTILFTCAFELQAEFDFDVSGRIVGREKGVLAFSEIRSRAGDYIEVPFENGRFVFTGKETQIKFYGVALLEDVQKGVWMPFTFILEPGATVIEITCKAQQVGQVTLTPLKADFLELGEMNRDLLKYISFEEYFATKMDEAKKQAHSRTKLNNLSKNRSDSLNQFLTENANNVLGLFLVYAMEDYFSSDQIQLVLSRLPESLKKSKYYNIVRSEFIGRNKNEVGEILNDFQLPDRNGNFITLSEVASKNNYTLLEFWGSWCGPCIQKARQVIPLYEKYRSKKFEVYGIALEVKKERWISAMDKEGYNWVNVVEMENEIGKDYFISKLLNPENKIPYNILIDRNRRVVAKDLSIDKLEKILAEVR